MKTNRLFTVAAALLLLAASCSVDARKIPSEVTMTKDVLKDKILGAWAGQAIGCTYGGPTEFKYNGMINDKVLIEWDEHKLKWWFDNSPGLYDDIYMDLTFVDVFQKEGLDAPIDSFAYAFANAPYPLWHANKQGRYNILSGLMPPESGYWENNAHADDIDFQIEADYAGIMAPGMPAASSHYADGIGHMMNYGDGWYGGVYVAAMYSLAFVTDDINFIANEALKAIPAESNYHQAMADVIAWSKKYPENWEITWALYNRKYGYDVGCPDGVDNPFNIDAVTNSAYILIGLLYGHSDFFETIDIATRCGQDSDCNPASVGGILGTILGYSNIPEYWRKPVEEVLDRNFVYTDISLLKATDYSFDQALKVIELNGGKVSENEVTIKTQKPETVRYEKSFEGHYPLKRVEVKQTVTRMPSIEFEGNGVVVKSHYYKAPEYVAAGHVGEVEIYLDGKLDKVVKYPVDGNGASTELYQKYNLPVGKHTVEFKYINKEKDSNIVIDNYLVYTDKPRDSRHEGK